jgi:ABC-type multidrug transport system ATPase subunit
MLSVRDLKADIFGPVDLDVSPGACIAVRGPSGAGKSVLLRAIVDLDPNDGDVYWNGRSRNRMPSPEWRRIVGLIPAETGWWADRVASHFQPQGAAEGLLQAVGLPGEAMEWEVARLSTGERHRLGLVRAIAQKPEVILLDEPTASLDGEATALVEQLLKQQLAAGVAMILVTHDPAQAERLASQTATMEKGVLSGLAPVTP